MIIILQGATYRTLPLRGSTKLSLENCIKRILNEVNYILVNAKTAFKCMYRDVKEIFTAYIRSRLEYASPFWIPRLRRHTDLLEKVHRQATKTVPEIWELSYREKSAAIDARTKKTL